MLGVDYSGTVIDMWNDGYNGIIKKYYSIERKSNYSKERIKVITIIL